MTELSWHRRQALHLAAQLPDQYEDALAVVRATERLVHEWLKGDDPEKRSAPVFKLREVKE